MFVAVNSGTILGIDGCLVRVEVDLSLGLPAFDIVGLPDTAVRESKERVRAAIKNSGFDFPGNRITVNLAPANIRKEGPLFDLPIAVGILAATGQMSMKLLENSAFVGELSLDGSVRPVAGCLPIAIAAREENMQNMLVPHENSQETALVRDITVLPVLSLRKLVDYDQGKCEIAPVEEIQQTTSGIFTGADFADIKGQEHVKRALEVAAAGGHNLLMVGPPGSGKTMLARSMPSIMPQMTFEEALEVTKICSIAGMIGQNGGLITERPFRSPHHSVSYAALIGGGRSPRPGEVSLSHNGVLFLDELPEFSKHTLEHLRQPLEDGTVTISRVQASYSYPSRFVLIAAMNPCPCGYYGDTGGRECTCSVYQIQRYNSKISGPLLDRIDIQVTVPRVSYNDISSKQKGESSAEIRQRVEEARSTQHERFAGTNVHCNADMTSRQLRKFANSSSEAEEILSQAFQKMHLSARAYDRILKVARTIADLAKSETITPEHVAEAIQYRCLDRNL